MESFWSSIQIEQLNRQRWRTLVELATAIADYIEPKPGPNSHIREPLLGV